MFNQQDFEQIKLFNYKSFSINSGNLVTYTSIMR